MDKNNSQMYGTFQQTETDPEMFLHFRALGKYFFIICFSDYSKKTYVVNNYRNVTLVLVFCFEMVQLLVWDNDVLVLDVYARNYCMPIALIILHDSAFLFHVQDDIYYLNLCKHLSGISFSHNV